MQVGKPRSLKRGNIVGGINTVDSRDSDSQPFSIAVEKSLRSEQQNLKSSPISNTPPLPDELAILNQYGIGRPYLNAASALSKKLGMPALEILIRSGAISRDLWFRVQEQLRPCTRVRLLDASTRKILLDQAINNLSANLPDYSAARTFSKTHKILLLLAAIVAVIWSWFALENFLVISCQILSLFYFASTLLRGSLLAAYEPTYTELKPSFLPDQELPVYSILVALYQEANMIPQLTKNLMRLDWPPDLLDIKLICEEDDPETINAIRNAGLPRQFELIVVPPASPRTKPKALNYALPHCRGEYLVLYDAEDNPSPGQLHEAYGKFRNSDSNLACIQAPLRICNGEHSWLARMFDIEYLTLFKGILPVLAKRKFPIPLGGTSNHFNGLR